MIRESTLCHKTVRQTYRAEVRDSVSMRICIPKAIFRSRSRSTTAAGFETVVQTREDMQRLMLVAKEPVSK